MEDRVQLTEGKTKILFGVPIDEDAVDMKFKPDLTAFDGGKHDLMEGKEVWSTETVTNVFRLLKARDIPCAFIDRMAPDEIRAVKCEMLPLEVLWRRKVAEKSSYRGRNPGVPAGWEFRPPLVEFCLKTSNKNFRGTPVPGDDPIITRRESMGLWVHDHGIPVVGEGTFINSELLKWHLDGIFPFADIENMTQRVGIVLEDAWGQLGIELEDFKIEFGYAPDGRLLLADDIDNGSWRIRKDGVDISKQGYRDGQPIPDVALAYQQVAELTRRFAEFV